MKAAYWGLGIVMLGLFGLFLISLFGDITVTNQQDYTLLKNAVEASMHDALDEVSYRKGFCVCTNEAKDPATGVYKFDSVNDYTIQTLYGSSENCNTTGFSHCEKLVGEIKINEEVFVESFIRRFSENVNGNKDYKIIVQDVIEYPPKVSVEVRSYNKYGIFDSTEATFSDSDFDISNRIDSIFEYK